MKKIYEYNGKYGKIVIDLKGKKLLMNWIGSNSNQDYLQQQYLYSEIIDELFGDDIEKIFPPKNPGQCWNGEATDFGFKAINNKIEIIIDAEGTFIYEL